MELSDFVLKCKRTLKKSKFLRSTKRSLVGIYERQRQKWFLSHEEINGGGTSIEANLLLLAHSLEKGMGLPNPRSKFGYDKAVDLLELLEEYHTLKLNKNRFAYIESLSILGAYFEFTDNDMRPFELRYKALATGVEENHSGFDVVTNIDAIYDVLDMEQDKYFMQSRHSIRSYEKQAIDAETLQKVIALASCAPSACNRQPVKVYATTDPEKVNAVSALIPGNKGFEDEIPNWAIVTADRRMFSFSESLQWYVNGGIYLAYLIQAFHTYHIASCIFQIPVAHKNTPKLSSLICIPENEVVIAAVGFGFAKNRNKFLAAERRPVDEVLIKF